MNKFGIHRARWNGKPDGRMHKWPWYK
jgi:hypothetical protein